MSEGVSTPSAAEPTDPEVNHSIFFMARKAFQACVPFTAVIELTYRCNFRCSMCYVIHENNQGELTTDEWKRVLDELAEAGTMYLEVTGGEIFLRRDLWDILEHAQRRKFLIHLFTNGSYLTSERIRRLKEFRNIVGVSVSLYGEDQSSFEEVTHAKGSFTRVMAGLKELSDSGLRVRTRTPVTSETLGGVDGMRQLSKDHSCYRFQWAPLIVPKDDGDVEPTKERIGDEDMRSLWRQEDLQSYSAKRVNWNAATCSAGRSLVGISPQGDVYPCIQLRQSSGNLRSKPFRELWKSPSFDRIRAFTHGQMEKCRTCSVSNFCSPCIGLNHLENGDIAEPSTETCRMSTLVAETYREGTRLPVLRENESPEGSEVGHCPIS